MEPYGGPNTSLARGRKLLICISSWDQLLGSIVGECAVRGSSKRGCNSRCCCFLTQLHLTCRFVDTGWELCDLGQVASPRPFFGRGTVTESVCRAVGRIRGGDAGRVCRVHSARRAPPAVGGSFLRLSTPLAEWWPLCWPLSCLPPSGFFPCPPTSPHLCCGPWAPTSRMGVGASGGGHSGSRSHPSGRRGVGGGREADGGQEGCLGPGSVVYYSTSLGIRLQSPQQLGAV